MKAVVLGIMKRLKQKPEELGVVELVSFGHLLCGFSSSEISHLDPFNLRSGVKISLHNSKFKTTYPKPLKALCSCPLVRPLCFCGRWYCRVLSSRPRHWRHACPVLWASVQSAAGALRSSLRLGLWQVLMVDSITISLMDNIHMQNWAGLEK